MALKEDPNTLKQRDRLSSLLMRAPGVELVPYTPGVSPEGAVEVGGVVCSVKHLPASGMLPTFEYPEHVRPLACVLTSSNEGEEFERAVLRGLEELRKHLVGDPADYRHLHLPLTWLVPFARPITLDGFPVRVIHTWDNTHGAYRTTFDAHRPITVHRTINP
jgi:hypothetical protein